METSILKLRLLLLTCLHLRSRPGYVYFVKHFSYKDIKKATDGFRRIINNSSNGASYLAEFQNGHVAVAKEIKIFNDHDDDGAFYREVQLLGRLHHRHIAALSGFSTGRKRFLVFENLEKGSLKDHLSDPLKTPLNWRTRLQIAVGIAAALEYLHFFCDPPVYHVSISSSTIMLDENFVAKLSDASLLSGTGSLSRSSHSSRKESTDHIGKNTIFQLGLLILELITGQSSEKGGNELVQWIQESHFSRSINNMIDPDLGNDYNSKELKSLLSIARMCIESVDKPSRSTSQILRYLKMKSFTSFVMAIGVA